MNGIGAHKSEEFFCSEENETIGREGEKKEKLRIELKQSCRKGENHYNLTILKGNSCFYICQSISSFVLR